MPLEGDGRLIMDFKKQNPIFQQIADQLCTRIVAGEWKSDERMVSVRDVAAQLQVNPNTVLRSFDLLQQGEIIYNRRGVGYFVAQDAKRKIIEMRRNSFFKEELPPLFQQMKVLGIGFYELQAEYEKWERDNKE